MSLKDYRAKRDFSRTKEPAGTVHATASGPAPAFVVQKHAATRLHYDFRLEMEGVLKSWAVPKGFPTRKGDRRLAVQVEDHPLEYGSFEGTIPEGNYGAGTVMLWDRGTYQVGGDQPLRALHEGKLHLFLKGKKLKGEWALVRLRHPVDTAKPQWLLLKAGADVPDFSERAENRSVLTKRSMEEIAGARKRNEWVSHRPSSQSTKAPAQRSRLNTQSSTQAPARRLASSAKRRTYKPTRSVKPAALAQVNLDDLPKSDPDFVEPMKALLSERLPKGPEWIYEIKFDGVRALAIKNKGGITLTSRAGNDLSGRYPEVFEALRRVAANKAVLDGEVVALDPQGRSSFQLLQSWHNLGANKPPLLYYVFDLINLEGHDLRRCPLSRRKELAQALVADLGPTIRFSPGIRADSARVMGEMQARGLEGLIAKQKDSCYEAGRRSGAWVKFKWSNEQEFVIGGYTEPKGGRSHFGAILVGYYERERLLFAGKVGTGFNEQQLTDLYRKFQKLARPDCPFANLPEKLPRPGGLTASQMRRCTWLEPRLVCQVRFAEWTRDYHLRQPAFLGLREDKAAKEVVRETS